MNKFLRFNIKYSVFFIVLTILVTSCIYTFNPGSTGNAKTLFIGNIINNSGGGPPFMSQLLTEKLKTFYQQNSNLSLVNSNGDWIINGEIVGYQISPIAPQQNNQAGGNRLTITINISYENVLDRKKDFKQAFSSYDDYGARDLISNVQDGLLEKIFDLIVLDIYTKTTSDW